MPVGLWRSEEHTSTSKGNCARRRYASTRRAPGDNEGRFQPEEERGERKGRENGEREWGDMGCCGYGMIYKTFMEANR